MLNCLRKWFTKETSWGTFYGRNLFIWSPWPNTNLEFGTLSGTLLQGFETAQFLPTRTFRLLATIGI
jgi:hypothetical protein